MEVEFKSVLSEWGCRVFEEKFTTSTSPLWSIVREENCECACGKVRMNAFDVLQKHGPPMHTYVNY